MNTIEIICTAIATASTVLGGVWFIIDRVTKSGIKEYRLSQAEDTIGKLPCKDHAESMKKNEMYSDAHQQRIAMMEDVLKSVPCSAHESELSKHTELLESNNEMLIDVSKWIMRIDPDMIGSLVRKASPYRMTEIGKIIFNISGAQRAIESNSEYLISQIENISPKTAYDVEDCTLTVLMQNRAHDMFNDIKAYLYKSPEIIKITNPETGMADDVKVSMQGILKIMSIDLRDRYLNKHQDIE